MLPQLALVLVSGAIADRMSLSRLMVTAELVAMAAWGGLAAAIAERSTAIVALGVLAAVAGAATSMFAPAMSGVVAELVDGGNLQRANAMIRVGQNAALLLGLGVSGVVVAAFGAAWAHGGMRSLPEYDGRCGS